MIIFEKDGIAIDCHNISSEKYEQLSQAEKESLDDFLDNCQKFVEEFEWED
jgi:predicted HicB family RNase H-like nuclease